DSARIRNAVIAPAAISPTTPAPPIIPSPGAATRPFFAISDFASSTSCRTSSDRARVRSWAPSPRAPPPPPDPQRQVTRQILGDLAPRPLPQPFIAARHLAHPLTP